MFRRNEDGTLAVPKPDAMATGSLRNDFVGEFSALWVCHLMADDARLAVPVVRNVWVILLRVLVLVV